VCGRLSILLLVAACSSSSNYSLAQGPPVGGPGLTCDDAGPAPICVEDSGIDIAVQETKSACPASPVILTGKTPAGGSCSISEDCAPTCCTCDGGGKPTLAAICSCGRCAPSDEVCCSFARGSCP
jgi:hypothetical protein